MCGSQMAQMTQIFTLHTLPASEINLRNLRNLREIVITRRNIEFLADSADNADLYFTYPSCFGNKSAKFAKSARDS